MHTILFWNLRRIKESTRPCMSIINVLSALHIRVNVYLCCSLLMELIEIIYSASPWINESTEPIIEGINTSLNEMHYSQVNIIQLSYWRIVVYCIPLMSSVNPITANASNRGNHSVFMPITCAASHRALASAIPGRACARPGDQRATERARARRGHRQ